MSESVISTCPQPTNFFLFATALRSFFLVIATHLLAGEVDTALSAAPLVTRVFWLSRYFNPLNLSWRYYSIFAYRCVASSWTQKQLALINHEAHPFLPPVPYLVNENVHEYEIRRLEVAGAFSSQGILTLSSAYQGILAVQYGISTEGIPYLPNITAPLAIMGLFRVMVGKWITTKVQVDAYPYPSQVVPTDCKTNKVVLGAWIGVLVSLLVLSFLPYKVSAAYHLPGKLLQFSMQVFYQYIAVSEFVFHAVFLSYGAKAWGNRIPFFDHWLYKLQTLGFLGLLAFVLVVSVADFVRHGYYRSCA